LQSRTNQRTDKYGGSVVDRNLDAEFMQPRKHVAVRHGQSRQHGFRYV
jgi:hypothetical protein